MIGAKQGAPAGVLTQYCGILMENEKATVQVCAASILMSRIDFCKMQNLRSTIVTAILLCWWRGRMQLQVFSVATAAISLLLSAHAQQTHCASGEDDTAKHILDIERECA